jgi:dTDP-4-dehydrorhamnose reductase
MKVLITGANGFLGHYLVSGLLKKGATVIATGQGACRLQPDHQQPFSYVSLDFTDLQTVKDSIEQYQPDYIIHAGAMTKPDDCELNPGQAYRVNSEGTVNMLQHCTTLIFYLYQPILFLMEKRECTRKQMHLTRLIIMAKQNGTPKKR